MNVVVYVSDVGEVVGVEVLSSTLGPVDLGTYLHTIGLPTHHILVLNITGKCRLFLRKHTTPRRSRY